MGAAWHFPIFIGASFLLFLGVLRLAMQQRDQPPPRATALWVAGIVVVGGMTFAKLGATNGLPIWLYYGLPAGLTWVLPPLVFRMTGREIARYVPLALLVAPRNSYDVLTRSGLEGVHAVSSDTVACGTVRLASFRGAV